MLRFFTYSVSLFLIAQIIGCTKNDSKSISPISVNPSIGTEPIANSPEAAAKKVEEIKEIVNSDPQYALYEEDMSALVSEGLVEESEMKEWVK